MDDDLAGRLAKDLDDGFEELVHTTQHFVFGVALRLTLDRHDAEDVAQEALVRAYRALQGYDAERIRAMRLRPWLARITLNVQRNRVRRRRDSTSGAGPAHEPVAATADRPEERAETAGRRAACARLLATLPEAARAVVVLRHVEGLSYAEVAEAVGKPVGTVKAQVHRAIGVLRQRIEEEEEMWTELA